MIIYTSLFHQRNGIMVVVNTHTT